MVKGVTHGTVDRLSPGECPHALVEESKDTFQVVMKWTNPSVLQFARESDPVEGIQRAAREMVLNAIEKGWTGPPFDPFELASILNYRVVPSQDVQEAMLTPDGRTYRIDFNPSQSHRRVRFSIAHELAHTLFDDCREQVRHRLHPEAMRDDEWQLEMLCNIAASEILMPAGNLSVDSIGRLTIDDLLKFQDEFDVSMEAILLRVVRLERRHCVAFMAASSDGSYRLDYAVETQGAGFGLRSGLILPHNTRVAHCRALGYTAKGDETWVDDQPLHVECVAIPGYPGNHQPRVAGIAYRKGDRAERTARITFVVGDATKPHGEGRKIIAHIVNDGAMRWGGHGFAHAIRKLWPAVQDDFVHWAEAHRHEFRLGHTHAMEVNDNLTVISMIAQHGFGESRLPRIRYQHLRTCLSDLRDLAQSEKASVHMPRIGCGEAGGNWHIIQDLILEYLSDHDVDVTVYDLRPQSTSKLRPEQQSLFAN
jgi:O-acetyl-ADP-ribose deacetylase (regulator of RNase III)